MKRIIACIVSAVLVSAPAMACDYSYGYGYGYGYNTTNVFNNYGGVMNIAVNSGSGYQEVNSYSYNEVSNDYCGLCGLDWGSCTCYDYDYDCGGASSSCGGYDRSGEGYYDSMGHYCEWGGYWECGQWIQTVGYWEGGCWYPAQYDPMLDIGYYDECGQYHYYNETSCGYGYSGGYGYGNCNLSGYVSGYDYSQQMIYDESCGWAADNRQWIDTQDDEWTWCGDYEYQENSGYYEDCEVDYEGYWIDVDIETDTINLVNNGVIILSGSCTCCDIYGGQDFSFDDQKCMGIWNTCSEGFYSQACGYMNSDCMVRCH